MKKRIVEKVKMAAGMAFVSAIPVVILAVGINKPMPSELREIKEESHVQAAEEVAESAEPCTEHISSMEEMAAYPNSYQTSDIELLAHLIMAEAGGTNYKQMYMTGSVVINRVNDEDYPNTIEEVVYQEDPTQYQCTKNGHIEKQPTDTCYEIAEDLVMNGTTIPMDIVYQAEFRQGSAIYEHIGNTYFCRK